MPLKLQRRSHMGYPAHRVSRSSQQHQSEYRYSRLEAICFLCFRLQPSSPLTFAIRPLSSMVVRPFCARLTLTMPASPSTSTKAYVFSIRIHQYSPKCTSINVSRTVPSTSRCAIGSSPRIRLRFLTTTSPLARTHLFRIVIFQFAFASQRPGF